ncbi:MAG: hypothetical protein IJ649_05535 [Oscillospiraceae bacterium]|nr:hypothetical protein [Oscillospiraceae bacterium]
MNTFSKVLSMFLVVVMCFGLFATSAYATEFDFGQGGSAASGDGGFTLGGSAPVAVDDIASDSFSLNDSKVQSGDDFTVNVDELISDLSDDKAEEKTEAEEEIKVEDGNTILFEGVGDTAAFDTPYSDNDGWTFTVASQDFKKSAPADIKITANKELNGDTFSAGIAYSTSATGSDLTALVQGSQYSLDSSGITIYANWLKTLAPGTYYFYGRRVSDVPVKLGFINVNKDTFTTPATVSGSPYDKNKNDSAAIVISGTFTGIEGFGVASVTGNYTHVLSVNEYSLDDYNTPTKVTLEKKYLDSLEDGEYYLIGFPNLANKGEQVNYGKFVVKSGELPKGDWTLTPDYQIWYSGTDPLTFYSDVFEAAGEGWNYKGYSWDVIVPDIRVSTRSNMVGATSVRIDQYWDLGYGYFMLGQNFLSSLSADETYYMQVIDARHPDINYTNVVSFRVGPTLRAIDTDKHVINSTRSLRFRSSAPISEVYVGNIMLTDPADYGVSWDGKTVTLSFEFLNKRSAGNTYTIKVRTTDGEWAATTFQVLTTAQGSASPRTGDESNLGLWAAFLLLSGTAVVVLVPKLRKQEF